MEDHAQRAFSQKFNIEQQLPDHWRCANWMGMVSMNVIAAAQLAILAGGPGSGRHYGGALRPNTWSHANKQVDSQEKLEGHGWKTNGGDAYGHKNFPGHSLQLNKQGGFAHYRFRGGDAKVLGKGTHAQLGSYLQNLHGEKKNEHRNSSISSSS